MICDQPPHGDQPQPEQLPQKIGAHDVFSDLALAKAIVRPLSAALCDKRTLDELCLLISRNVAPPPAGQADGSFDLLRLELLRDLVRALDAARPIAKNFLS